jgi:hypothetical protein
MDNGILQVSEESRKTIDAISVRLRITVQGESFVFGNAAIEKCHEVKLAVAKITALDAEAIITIDGVTIQSETGWFTKASKGNYRVMVALSDMGKVNDVLGAIMELKNVSIDLSRNKARKWLKAFWVGAFRRFPKESPESHVHQWIQRLFLLFRDKSNGFARVGLRRLRSQGIAHRRICQTLQKQS